MDPIEEFIRERKEAAERMSQDEDLKKKSLDWMLHADNYKYTYHFNWLGRPIIKYPNDIVVMQEIIWDVKPDLIIETGIAHHLVRQLKWMCIYTKQSSQTTHSPLTTGA